MIKLTNDERLEIYEHRNAVNSVIQTFLQGLDAIGMKPNGFRIDFHDSPGAPRLSSIHFYSLASPAKIKDNNE